jgi:septum formation protein
LGLVVPADRIIVVPPRDASEAGFDGLHDLAAIETRLAEIARVKADDVADQLGPMWPLQVTSLEPRPLGSGGTQPLPDGRSSRRPSFPDEQQVVIAADTTIVATGADGKLHVIGQPPDGDDWKEAVRTCFRDYFAGRTHLALTVLCVRTSDGRTTERLTSTEVGFIADVEKHLEWYVETGEPRGKAGGYAIQGAGSIFVSHVTGSLTNVIGLPLEALLSAFEELHIDVRE